MKDKIDALAKKLGISRREFIKLSAQSGAMLGAAPFLAGCSNNEHSDSNNTANTETKTYYFDLSHTDEGDEHHLVLGSKMHKLHTSDSQVIKKSGNPLLQAIPEGSITHHITHDFPSDSIQACYIRTIKPGDPKGVWGMSLSFFHLPSASVRRAALRGAESLASSTKLSYYGIDASLSGTMAIDDAYLHEDAIKSFTDMAVDLAFHHPEVLSGESDSAAHIQKNIIAVQPSTYELAIKLNQQGPATESGGWATLEPHINKDTGEPYLNSQGLIQYFPRYSDTTNTYLGNAINPSLESVKNDVTLGVNITDLDPTVENPEMMGKLWKIYDGIPTVEADQLSDSDGFLTCPNKSRRHGYKATFISEDAGTVTFKVENWFVRYLGIYVQFLNSNGDKIKVSDLPDDTKNSFLDGTSMYDSDYCKFADVIPAEWEILGIPVKHQTKEITFMWPEMASSAVIIAGGLGTGKETYDDTLLPACVCTALLDLALPTFFLVAGAATALVSFTADFNTFSKFETRLIIADVIGELAFDISAVLETGDAKAFIDLGKTIAEMLLAKTATWWFAKKAQKKLVEGEILDSVPLVGKILAAVGAAALVAAIAETITEVIQSPKNYDDFLTAKHDIEVKIKPDTDDKQGFPAVADYYVVKAMFDSGTPVTSGPIRMPGTTVTDPIYYTFKGVPYGGHVKVCVGFYADKDNWQAGKGCTNNFENNVGSTVITIEEILVPLNSATVYGHKQKIALDADGNHVWEAAAEGPSEKADSLGCESVDGNLCELTGITVSEEFGTFGYAWKSYSSDVTSCKSDGAGQLNQFATASITQDPQDSYLAPECGFPAPARIVFDLMSSQNNNYYLDTTDGMNYVRQVRLELGKIPTIDKYNSDICWGRFNLPSDALLLHPSRKLISINTARNKIEILELPDVLTSNNRAPIAVAYSGKGTRHGLVRGPVAAAVSPDGVILILESKNKRVQAFDTGLNPVPYFKKTNYHFPLKSETEIVYYVDMAMEYTGYIYILSYTASLAYRLDIYDKGGTFVSRTTGFNAAKMTVDLWRNVYSLNYEVLKMPNGTQPTITEPSVSEWIPSVP